MTKNADLYSTKPSTLVVYSTSWCPDCRRTKQLLISKNVQFLEVDIGKDNEAFIFIEKTTRRVRIPTLIFPDGSILVEPEDDELLEKLGLS